MILTDHNIKKDLVITQPNLSHTSQKWHSQTRTHTLVSITIEEAELSSWTVFYCMISSTLFHPNYVFMCQEKNQPGAKTKNFSVPESKMSLKNRLNCIFVVCRCGCVYQPWLDRVGEEGNMRKSRSVLTVSPNNVSRPAPFRHLHRSKRITSCFMLDISIFVPNLDFLELTSCTLLLKLSWGEWSPSQQHTMKWSLVKGVFHKDVIIAASQWELLRSGRGWHTFLFI